MTTINSTSPISLSFAEISSLPIALGFDLAHSLAGFGRMSDARDALLCVDWSRDQQGAPHSRHDRLFMRGVQVALSIGAVALEDFLAAAEGIDPTTLTYSRDRSHCLTQEKQLACASALDDALRASPDLAMILLKKSPAWVSLHGDAEDRCHNFFTEMLPLFTPDLLQAFLARGEFGERLVKSCAGNKQQWADENYRQFIDRMRQAISRPRNVDLMAELLRHTLPLIAAERRSSGLRGPLLPERWMQSLMLSSQASLRRQTVDAFGLRPCLDDLLAMDRVRPLCIEAALSGSAEAVGVVLECFGDAFFSSSQQEGSAAPIIASMISHMPILEFRSAIKEISRRGLMPKLSRDCSLKFWALIESPCRKKGDALALCVATGKTEHAQTLLSAIPDLNRRSASDMVAYVKSRPVKNGQKASVAWEQIIIAEAIDALPATARSEPARLRPRL